MTTTATDGEQGDLSGTVVPTKSTTEGSGNVPIGTGLSGPVAGDVAYIAAALSWYTGGPAGPDVRDAWDRTLEALRRGELAERFARSYMAYWNVEKGAPETECDLAGMAREVVALGGR